MEGDGRVDLTAASGGELVAANQRRGGKTHPFVVQMNALVVECGPARSLTRCTRARIGAFAVSTASMYAAPSAPSTGAFFVRSTSSSALTSAAIGASRVSSRTRANATEPVRLCRRCANRGRSVFSPASLSGSPTTAGAGRRRWISTRSGAVWSGVGSRSERVYRGLD